jgi:hypothetical protein
MMQLGDYPDSWAALVHLVRLVKRRGLPRRFAFGGRSQLSVVRGSLSHASGVRGLRDQFVRSKWLDSMSLPVVVKGAYVASIRLAASCDIFLARSVGGFFRRGTRHDIGRPRVRVRTIMRDLPDRS